MNNTLIKRIETLNCVYTLIQACHSADPPPPSHTHTHIHIHTLIIVLTHIAQNKTYLVELYKQKLVYWK